MAEVADLLNIGGAEDALDGGHAWAGGRCFAHEVGLELLHPGAGEERCRVADGDERPGGQKLVAPLLEEAKVGFANFVGCAWWIGHCWVTSYGAGGGWGELEVLSH